ncbi:DNA/RNA helicase [Striga asiatica]|uniref:DNA/RNA helicase n=1 Tax=Striga asiatica TaxID=4170 RepID=A0A5A7R4Y6_STRAF|nr:DNA/RNA helicase [Striga asiatica]
MAMPMRCNRPSHLYLKVFTRHQQCTCDLPKYREIKLGNNILSFTIMLYSQWQRIHIVRLFSEVLLENSGDVISKHNSIINSNHSNLEQKFIQDECLSNENIKECYNRLDLAQTLGTLNQHG